MAPAAAPGTGSKARSRICHICKKGFTRAEHLQRHIFAHENRKPYSCKACTSNFTRADVLQRHMKSCPDYRRLVDGEQSLSHDSPEDLTRNRTRKSARPDDERTELRSNEETEHVSPNQSLNRRMSTTSMHAVPGAHELTTGSSFQNQTRDLANFIEPPQSSSSTHSNTDFYHPTSGSTASYSESLHMLTQTSHSSVPLDRVDGNFQARSGFVQGGSGPAAPISFENLYYLNNNGQDLDTRTPGRNKPTTGLAVPDGEVELFDLPFDTTFSEELFPFQDFSFAVPYGGTPQALARINDSSVIARLYNSRDENVPDELRGSKPGDRVSEERHAEKSTGGNHAPGLRVSHEDVIDFKKSVLEMDTSNLLSGYEFPSRSRIVRSLAAYFECYAPHTPIVHPATFSLTDSSPALVFAMLAIGSIYLSEPENAMPSYQAACMLLAQHQTACLWKSIAEFELWPLQAMLLCAQFGAFSNDSMLFIRSQQQFSLIPVMLKAGVEKANKIRSEMKQDWSTWMCLETIGRLASWAHTLSGLILAYDLSSYCIVPHQLCDMPRLHDENMWNAPSAHEWATEAEACTPHTTLGLWTLAKAVAQGEPISATISPFGLLTVIGSILFYICSHERLSIGLCAGFGSTFTRRMERSLAHAEALWRERQPPTRLGWRQADPLLADCSFLLGSSYYHLYANEELYILKHLAGSPGNSGQLPPVRSPESARKAVTRAANSWLAMADIGIVRLQRVAPLEYGGHAPVEAYEAALLLSWWLSINPPSRSSSSEDSTDHRREANKELNELFFEIFAELQDQGIQCGDDIDRASAPLVFYGRLMQSWFWQYTKQMEHNLRAFSLRIGRSQ